MRDDNAEDGRLAVDLNATAAAIARLQTKAPSTDEQANGANMHGIPDVIVEQYDGPKLRDNSTYAK